MAGKRSKNPSDWLFMTLPDPNVDIKGSVDPLRITLLWDHFGRKVITNLTTITSSVRQFSTLILAIYFARQAIEAGKAREEDFIELFLKAEQVLGYARFAHDRKNAEADIRGINRIKARMDTPNPQLPISVDRDGQIMSNQRAYGLWGMFSVAAMNSGLIDRANNCLTPPTREMVEREIIQALERRDRSNLSRMINLITRTSKFQPKGAHQQLASSLASCLGTTYTRAEKDFYLKYLVRCESNQEASLQQQFWKELEAHNGGNGWGKDFDYQELQHIIDRSQSDLKERLLDIAALEPLLGLCTRLFASFMGQQGNKLEDVARNMRAHWSSDKLAYLDVERLEGLRPELVKASRSEGIGNRFLEIARALRDGDYEQSVKLLLEQNTEVMQERGGGPWISVEDGTIDVRLQQQERDLPDVKELPSLWEHTYFLNSLKKVGGTLDQARIGHA